MRSLCRYPINFTTLMNKNHNSAITRRTTNNNHYLTTPISQSMWLLITAHPDDESMFFIPTLRNLINFSSSNQKDTKSDNNTNIQLLCLSNGDYRDISDGPIRTKETYKACSIIGIQNDSRTTAAVTVLNDDRMKDGPNEVWSEDLIANSILEHICKAIPSMLDESITKPDKKQDYILSGPKDKKKMQQSWCYMDHKSTPQSPKAKTKDLNIVQTIDINLLTFDKGGVSNHPNHIDVFKGVQYFLNEKCIVETCKSSEQHNIAKLRLYQEKSNNNIAIELNVSLHTLRTISNPLYKYFLWMFVDIIPYLFIWLFQVVIFLVYFLLGGLLWGKKGSSPQIQQFSGKRSIKRGGNSCQQYRIMDPILVWRAMAAHYSQFVWYRRLSVMFSRYTYINDLEKINPIYIQDDDEDDDSIISLPPVVAIKEEESSPDFLLSPLQMNSLQEAVLPTGIHQRPWKRIYSLIRDGDSFVSFRKQLENWHGSQGHQSSILVVKTTTGELIGGYASIPIVPLKSSLGSAAGSCLFRMNTKEKDDTENIVEVYGKTYTATKKIVFDATRCMIAFGGGDDSDGIDEGFGLCLDDNFARGTTARCSAFQNEPLVCSQDGIFDVLDVEIWGFVFGELG